MVDVDGDVAAGFGPVADAFRRNFTDRGEIGGAVAVHHRGRLVVDLAGGRDPVRDRAFDRETLMMVASCSKGAVATCVAMLVGSGDLDPRAPVAAYWPEFAQAGKDHLTLAMVLGHEGGLPYPDPGSGLRGLDQLAGPGLLRQLEQQAPWWEPGSAFAYHPVTYGTLLGEVVRRVTGQTIGAWFAEHVAGPLGLEYWIGLPAALDDRVAPSVRQAGPDGFAQDLAQGPPAPGSYAARRLAAVAELPRMDPDPHDPAQRRAYHGIEVPAAHGITNARSLSRMYAAVIGEVDGIRLVDPDVLDRAVTPQTDGLLALVESGTAGPDIRFGWGYQLASPSMPGFGPASFGHTGAGGRLGLADPTLEVSFGYVCNSMRTIGAGGDPRWAGLLAAVTRCL